MSFKIKDQLDFGGRVVLSRNRRDESAGLYLRGGRLNVATGGITIDAGGLTVTAGGLTVTAGGLDVTGNIGFFGTTPVAQASAYTQTFSTADKTHAASTVTSIAAAVPTITNYTAHAAGAVAVTSNAATDLDTTAAALATLENEVTSLAAWATEVDLDFEALIVDVADLKQLVNAVIDDLQAYGLFQ